MSLVQKVKQVESQYQALTEVKFDLFIRAPGQYPEWDGYSVAEFEHAFNYAKDLIADALRKKVLPQLSVGALNGLISNIANTVSHLNVLFANIGSASHYQNAASQLDALLNHLQLYDVPILVSGGADLDKMRALYEAEAQRLAQLRDTSEGLNRSIKTLIEPAVAGSLSKSFSDRRKTIFWGRVFWFCVSTAGLSGAIFYTFDFVQTIRTVIEQSSAGFWPTVILRSLILVPIYFGVIFAFAQYKKERDLEEEYAHKAAVASTLPNYGELAKDVVVKDQIVTGASNVIFTSPIAKVQHYEKDLMPTEAVKGLIGEIGKAIRRT
jgi:hypothetical protein